MGIFDKFKSEARKNLHSRIADTESAIKTAEGQLVAARDSIQLKKQSVQKLIDDANVLHAAHDEVDELFAKFNSIIG